MIAALDKPDEAFRKTNLSPAVSAGKLVLTTLSLLGVLRWEGGPTVHVGASLMYLFGRWFGFKDPRELSHFLLAGGAAGIAAAFNTPLAGIVFAIEELSGRFEHRFSGTLLTAVIVGGVVSLGLLGNYTYFGHVTAGLPLGQGGWPSCYAGWWLVCWVGYSPAWCWPALQGARAGWAAFGSGIRCCWQPAAVWWW